jgi:hypothetical protein
LLLKVGLPLVRQSPGVRTSTYQTVRRGTSGGGIIFGVSIGRPLVISVHVLLLKLVLQPLKQSGAVSTERPIRVA